MLRKNYIMTIQDLEQLSGDAYNSMRYFARHGIPVIRLEKGDNVAYAYIEKNNLLSILASSGGGAGTDLFNEILKEQATKGEGLQWHADKGSADSFYKKLGLGNYATPLKGLKNFNHYNMSPNEVKNYVEHLKEPIKWVTINGKHVPIYK